MDLTRYLAQQSLETVPTEAAPGTASAPTGSAAPAPAFDFTFLLMIGGIFIFMYFVMIRPQRQEDKRKKEMLSTLQKGDQVVTTSGIIGSIASVKEETIALNVGDGARIEFLRSAIATVRDKKQK